ncbi:MAG: hypothetical protein R3190_16975, partial [Thermoanaerobaculia bacterium]|nr:hypothetical protein [Thermoanaerobaculia bacterium]
MSRPNASRRLWFAALTTLLVLVVAEAAATLAERRLARGGIVYRPTPLDDYAAYRRRRHPVLGWPLTGEVPGSFSAWGGTGRQPDGSRRSPALSAAPLCVATFGESFTWGDEVSDAAAWPNRLALRLGCRVGNWGVAGYGTDQAYLRCRESRPESPIVVLGIMPDNVVRNISRLFGVLYPVQAYDQKPRFVLGSAGLELIPLPDLEPAEYLRVVDDPGLLPHQDLVPGTELGPAKARWPHLWTIGEVLANR